MGKTRTKIVIFGAGVAGLSVAHALSTEAAADAFEITVIESNAAAGGFYQSRQHGTEFSEYSWHGFLDVPFLRCLLYILLLCLYV